VHELAGEKVNLTLLAPASDFVYRPMAVLEPFAQRPPRRLALSQFASELGAGLEPDGVSWVDLDARVVHTLGQHELPFDALMIAVGARTGEALPGAATLDVARAGESLRELIEAIDAGSIRTLALVAPEPFDGVIHGTLLSGQDAGRLYFTARLARDGAWDARVSDTPTRPSEAKIAARYLGPYLDRLWAEGPRWLAGELAWEAALARLEQ
jgi:hypothetical protein